MQRYQIKVASELEFGIWDRYVTNHPNSTLYHLFSWQKIICDNYGHRSTYLIAYNKNRRYTIASSSQEIKRCSLSSNKVVGVLPLVQIKHFLFGNNLLSIPFFDFSGILADDIDVGKALLNGAVMIGREIQADQIELRSLQPIEALCSIKSTNSSDLANLLICESKIHKARMVLNLPDSSDALMDSFKSKLRSQIRKPIKEGLKSTIGGLELSNDFYKVFSENMRDLGSPVHSKEFITAIMRKFPKESRIVIIYQDNKPLACGMIVGFKDTLQNPWASSLRKYSKLSPNMLLYWIMLEFACNNGFKYFDFGRSTPGEGSYKFKEQWGAKPEPLHWINIPLKGAKPENAISEDSKFQLASEIWKRLPVPMTRVIGPRIRKYIGL